MRRKNRRTQSISSTTESRRSPEIIVRSKQTSCSKLTSDKTEPEKKPLEIVTAGGSPESYECRRRSTRVAGGRRRLGLGEDHRGSDEGRRSQARVAGGAPEAGENHRGWVMAGSEVLRTVGTRAKVSGCISFVISKSLLISTAVSHNSLLSP
ncbi:hypothetical protein C3L33_23458, partial [Rhododendron williamsianum]